MVCTKQVCAGTNLNCVVDPSQGLGVVVVKRYYPHFQCEPGGVPNAYCSNFGKNFLCWWMGVWPAGSGCAGQPFRTQEEHVDICGL